MTDREYFRNELRQRLQHEEDNLEKLGCKRDAWKVLRVVFYEGPAAVRQAMAWARQSRGKGKPYPYEHRKRGGLLFVYKHEQAEELLGPSDDVIEDVKIGPGRRGRRTVTTPKWLAAQSAAVAAAALRHCREPFSLVAVSLAALENFRALRATPVRDAIRGAKVLRGLKEAGKKTGTALKQRAAGRRTLWQKLADNLHRRHPDWGKSAIAHEIAKKIGAPVQHDSK